LNRNFKEAEEKISSGIHPVADRAFIKIGSFIASILRESRKDKSLAIYYKKGPLGFLSDYIRISQEWPSDKKPFRFADDTEQLILNWEKDWNRVYTDPIQDLWISIQTDFDALGASLLQTFSGAAIYPDLIDDIVGVGYFYLDNNKPDKARSIMNACIKLYPEAVVPLRGLAAAHLWLGDTEEARVLLKKAFSLESSHSALSIRSLERLSQTLKREEKTKEFLALADITAELYPENTDLLKKTGVLFLNEGQKQKAIQYFQKALEVDPKLEDIKKRLEKLKKEDIK
jgi:tetratricopeptide (TPR) repeat protein